MEKKFQEKELEKDLERQTKRHYRGVKITMISGIFAGETRRVFMDEIDPKDLLLSSVSHGFHWNIDYSRATPEETSEWLKADIVCRGLLAQKEKRPFYFEGKKYENLEEWQGAISSSGKMVAIERDDEDGYWVKGVDNEQETKEVKKDEDLYKY